MTKKDYIKLAHVFKRKQINQQLNRRLDNDCLGETTSETMYFVLLSRCIAVLKADNPKFDADKFMRELDVTE